MSEFKVRDVFLSHSSVDKPRVRRLAEALENRGVSVWLDEREILPGASIPLALEEGIEASRVMVLCLSPAFLQSDWAKFERSAMSFTDPANAQRTLLPLLFADCVLPRSLAHLKHLNYLRHSEKVIDEIVKSLIPTKLLVVEQSEFDALHSDAKEKQRAGEYVAAAAVTKLALELALQRDASSGTGARELAVARSVHSRALLLCDEDPETVWDLANSGADASVLEGYPELLFSALVTKAEAATRTGRLQIARGATLAAGKHVQSENENRVLLQLKGMLALSSRNAIEAIDLYKDAELSFLSELASTPDLATHAQATKGIGSCLTNQAIAHRQVGQLAAARLALTRAVEWYVIAGSPIDELAALELLARCDFDAENWESGFASLDKAILLAEKENVPSMLADCLELKARALATTKQFSLASATIVRALATIRDDDADTQRRFHQMLATLAKEDKTVAHHHLDVARSIAEHSQDTLAIADVAHQTERLTEGGAWTPPPASDAHIAALQERLELSENPARSALTMHKIAGAYRSRGDILRAREWHRLAYELAIEIDDTALAAAALIGIAESEIVHDDDIHALEHLERALALVERVPAWEVRASALYFTGRVQARRGDFRVAHQTLVKALEVAQTHQIENLTEQIKELVDDLDHWFSMRALASIDLAGIAQRAAALETWYPEAHRDLRRLWWYWHGEEVMRNLVSNSEATGLIVTDDAREIEDLSDGLAVLFGVSTFVTTSSFAREDRVVTFVPFPAGTPFPYLNFISMVEVT